MAFSELLARLDAALAEAKDASSTVEAVVKELRKRVQGLATAMEPLGDLLPTFSVENPPVKAASVSLFEPLPKGPPFKCPTCGLDGIKTAHGLSRHRHAAHQWLGSYDSDHYEGMLARHCPVCGKVIAGMHLSRHIENYHPRNGK